MKQKFLCFFVIINTLSLSLQAQSDSLTASAPAPKPVEKKWYERFSFGGYTQVRYNRLLETNPDLRCDQCDASWGEGGGLFIRRARWKFSGDVHPRVYVYLQADMAAGVSGNKQNFMQMRDAYFDIALDSAKTFRIRAGQSKLPYGFENLQSSQNRLPFDRSDAINSAIANERDIAVLLYWAPVKIRKRFSYLIKENLKGSGDYGVFGFGVFNGETGNRAEANNSLHMVSRLTYPFQLGNGQIIETGIQAYTGKFTLTQDYRSSNLKAKNNSFDLVDQRAAASLIVYPQPVGFQAEFNIGRGPELDTATQTVDVKPLQGGYAMLFAKTTIQNQVFFPYLRGQYYNGGKKHETDARLYRVRELEGGVEWQPIKNISFTVAYAWSNRTFIDLRTLGNRQEGRLLRLQLQVNY